MNKLIDKLTSFASKSDDGRYVFYKGTNLDGGPPVARNGSIALECDCLDSGVFDYQVGYEYTEPHVYTEFDKECAAGINVSLVPEEAFIYGIRVVECLVEKKDIVSFPRLFLNSYDKHYIKVRVRKIEVSRELMVPHSICGGNRILDTRSCKNVVTTICVCPQEVFDCTYVCNRTDYYNMRCNKCRNVPIPPYAMVSSVLP